jgi:hypothetical protein
LGSHAEHAAAPMPSLIPRPPEFKQESFACAALACGVNPVAAPGRV